MSGENQPVRLRWVGINDYGGTFWSVTLDTRLDGRGRGGLALDIDVHTQKEGLCIAGNYISWEELHKAEERAKKFKR